jgi:hypothetical protein
MMRTQFLLAAGALSLAAASRAPAAVMLYNIDANGVNEVNAGGTPSQGDPDGSAIGTLQLDDGTGGTTGSATFNITVANVDLPFTGFHIHQAAANTTGPIVLNFGSPETFRSGNVVSGTVTGLSSTTIDNVFANPTGFYFNMHNNPFPGGAVRDQLPEPASLGVLSLATVGLLRRRRCRDV